MAVRIPKPVIDVSERVGSTFVENTLAGMTMGAIITAQPWSVILGTAATASVYALGKCLIALWTPPQGNANLLGFLSTPAKGSHAPGSTAP